MSDVMLHHISLRKAPKVTEYLMSLHPKSQKIRSQFFEKTFDGY